MRLKMGGIAAIALGLVILIFLVAFLIVSSSIFFLLILPVSIVLGIVIYILKKLVPTRKKPKNYIDAEFTVRRT